MNREDALLGLPEMMDELYNLQLEQKRLAKRIDQMKKDMKPKLEGLLAIKADGAFVSPMDDGKLRAYIKLSPRENMSAKQIKALVPEDVWKKAVTHSLIESVIVEQNPDVS